MPVARAVWLRARDGEAPRGALLAVSTFCSSRSQIQQHLLAWDWASALAPATYSARDVYEVPLDRFLGAATGSDQIWPDLCRRAEYTMNSRVISEVRSLGSEDYRLQTDCKLGLICYGNLGGAYCSNRRYRPPSLGSCQAAPAMSMSALWNDAQRTRVRVFWRTPTYIDEEGNETVTDVVLGDFDIAFKLEDGKPRQTPYAVGNVMWRSTEGQTGIGVTKV
ncbi:hypothetical protein OPT61_g297 [Boeremia exigua]|uniref:Uncharacterized protein n=1 Tax=Boeremia exigua TaxID=749465 RepID=A0ACC2IUG3_9PLEO|nr:hypothetical protein OPT61_g297 [Boeremia exigua]